MEKIPNRIYTREFREEAVRLITEGGLRVSEVSKRLVGSDIDIILLD